MSIIRGVAWMLMGRWVYNLITLVSFTIIVSLISPDEFGTFTLASTFIILSDRFFSDAIENLIVRHKEDEPYTIPTLFWVTLVLSAFLGLTIVLCAMPFSWLYHNPKLLLATQTMGGIVLLQGAASVPRALLLRSGKSRQYATNSASSNLIGAVAGILAAKLGAGMWSLIIQQAMLQLTMLSLCTYAAQFRPKLIVNRPLMREFGSHAITMLWSTLLNILGNRLDILVIGIFFGNTSTGIYGLAKRLIQIIQDIVASSFDKMLISFTSRTGRNDDREYFYRSSVIMQIVTATPSFVGFAVVSPTLIPILFGKEWAGIAPLAALMTLGGIFSSMVTIERARQMLAGQMSKIARVRVAELVIGIVTTLPAARFGMEAIALIFSLRYVLGYFLVVVSRVGWSEAVVLLGQTARLSAAPVIGSIIMAAAVSIALRAMAGIVPPELSLFIAVMIGVGIFVSALWGMKRLWLHHLVQR